MAIKTAPISYNDRLSTFQGYWPDSLEATFRQLAATGHVCDRPPLEVLDEGSHCISCNKFVKRWDSTSALQNSLFSPSQDRSLFEGLKLHKAACLFLQSRIPIDAQSIESDLRGNTRVTNVRSMWEQRSKGSRRTRTIHRDRPQTSSLFNLPTELRLQIYSQILPTLPSKIPITTINKPSIRLIIDNTDHRSRRPSLLEIFASSSQRPKPGPRDTTKTHLLSTCHAVYEEALDLLFANKTYEFDSTKLLYLFLRHIGQHGRRLLKAVDVTCGQREDAIAFALLAACPKLKAVTIRLQRPVLLLPGAPLWMLDGVACLLELSGMDRVTFGVLRNVPRDPRYLDESTADAAVVRRELTRPRGDKGGVRWVDGHPDL